MGVDSKLDDAQNLSAAGGKAGFEDEPVSFSVPVDSEHKSKVMRLYSFAWPHHRSFQINWLCFFTSFMSTFAAAPLITIIRQDLNLTKSGVSGANVAAITGTIFARVAMGSFCDAFGPRLGHAFLLSCSSTAVFCMSMVTDSATFIITRCAIGFALACFVCCQFWSSCMFSPNVVGTANAFAGGWGNSGGGAIQLIIPQIYDSLAKHHPDFVAWRWAFFFPGTLHVAVAALVLFTATDLPDGNYHALKKKGGKAKGKAHKEFLTAMLNYRTWILGLCYGYCFGVELTIDNNIASYFSDQFGKGVVSAGNYGAIFGLFNIISRPSGGIISDMVAKRYGMRGRLWWLWSCQTIGGVLCIGLGLANNSFSSTMIVLCFFSFFVQGAAGALFSVVPFVSKRALGLVCGFVGAGGNTGSAITQAIFFTPGSIAPYNSFKYMGCMIVGITLTHFLTYFPMWGGMLCPPKKGYTEEDYYFGEWTAAERENGEHLTVVKFANESKSQRGMLRLRADARAAEAADAKTVPQAV